ncbi:MAG: Esterase/lipase, partial [Friedmanniella sp.]|nr:Esterase/lipase [Friedmanniella sp.]
MTVRPALRALLALDARLTRDDSAQPVSQRRAASAAGPLQMRLVTARGRGAVRVTDRRVEVLGGQIRVRVYHATDAPGAGGRPVHLFLHGGCFWLGSVDEYDPLCRFYAASTGVTVVSVDYRLAPEHPFPTAPEDAYAALVWVAENAAELGVDAARLSVGGFSVGGNLAAVLTLMARDRGGPPVVFQLLESPVSDLTLSQPSARRLGTGYGLTRAALAEGYAFYLDRPEQVREPYASPLLAPDLSGLPPAYIRVSEYDPLRDDGVAYAERLRAAGVPVELHEVPGHLHASVYLSRFLPTARQALDRTAGALRSAHGL